MEKNIIIIDNYDSFTHLIKYYFEALSVSVCVIKNDDPCLKKLESLSPTHLVLSPGPGRPAEAGFTLDIIKEYHTLYPMLGICLGHQSIAECFGASVVPADEIMHGKCSIVSHTGGGLFAGIPSQFRAMRYHSLVVDPSTLSLDCAVTAWTVDSSGNTVIMAFQHREYPVFGIQYHPEAALTEHGSAVFQHFLTGVAPFNAF